MQPPEGKYRWKDRICDACAVALKKRGYTTYSGFQVQENLHVPTVYPGIVKIQGEAFPPDGKKWETVVTQPGAIRVCWGLARLYKSTFSDRGVRWDDFQKRDLAALSAVPRSVFTHALAGIACSGARPMVSARCEYNNAKALLGRVFRTPSEKPWGGTGPHPGAWKFVEQFVPDLLPGFKDRAMSVEEWIATMPSKRRKALSRASLLLKRRGWSPSCAMFKAFVKTELLPGFDKDEYGLVRITQMMDRLIQGPADETHVIAGPHLKPLIHRLKKIWTDDSPLFYGSTTPEYLHKWLNHTLLQGASTYIWCDFKMFDNTHSADSWAFMEGLYRAAGVEDPLFYQVMEVWRQPKGMIGSFKYQAAIMNASGRDDTALANGVLNGFASYLSAVAAWLEVPLLSLTVQMLNAVKGLIRLSVCGDDSLGTIPLCSSDRLTRFCKDMSDNIAMFGFEAKLCASTKLYDAVYLGMRPYPTKEGWYWGKTIGRATYKMGWVLLEGERDVMAHITGVADMHVLCSQHVPVLGDIARKIIALRGGAKRTPVVLNENKPWEWTYKSGVSYDSVTLTAVADMYTARTTPTNPMKLHDVGVQVKDVLGLLAAIEKVERLPCVLDHWLWKHMIWVDDL